MEGGEADLADAEKRVQRWSLFIRILRKKIPNWIVLDRGLIKFYKARLEQLLAQQSPFSSEMNMRSSPVLKDHFITVLKIVVSYCLNQKTDVGLVFTLLKVVELKAKSDLEFIHDFFKYKVPAHYTLQSQEKLFKQFLEKINSESIRQEGNTLKLANRLVVIPILREVFKGGHDSHILTSEVVTILRSKIKFLYENPGEPAWVLIELSLLLDYIVAKTNFTNSHEEFHELLKDVLIFAWTNVGTPREGNKMLKNMSKLLVSRLISRF